MHCGTPFETSPPPIAWYWDHLVYDPAMDRYPIYDPAVSARYPVVKGTWSTANAVALRVELGTSRQWIREFFGVTDIEIDACVDWTRDNS